MQRENNDNIAKVKPLEMSYANRRCKVEKIISAFEERRNGTQATKTSFHEEYG